MQDYRFDPIGRRVAAHRAPHDEEIWRAVGYYDGLHRRDMDFKRTRLGDVKAQFEVPCAWDEDDTKAAGEAYLLGFEQGEDDLFGP